MINFHPIEDKKENKKGSILRENFSEKTPMPSRFNGIWSPDKTTNE